MAFIATVADDEAAGAAAELIGGDRARLGYVPNHTRLFAHRPSVYAAWRQLVTAVAGNMDDRRYELTTLAAARNADLEPGLRDSLTAERPAASG